VFATHPQAERLAVSELARNGYTAYLPLIAVHRRDPVTRTMVHVVRVPLFAGYVFVWIDGTWGAARRSAGVREILMGMNGMPASVPQSLVERLQAEDAQRCELIAQSLPALNVGASVVVSEGPMALLPGTVISCDGLRTQIRVALFGRFVPVWLDRAVVELA
jgi:transcription antitermination factor NusG